MLEMEASRFLIGPRDRQQLPFLEETAKKR
jgi:hypothetical protein